MKLASKPKPKCQNAPKLRYVTKTLVGEREHLQSMLPLIKNGD